MNVRNVKSAGRLWISWLKGSTSRKLWWHADGSVDEERNYVSIQEGERGETDIIVKWNASDKAVAATFDSTDARDLAFELKEMADRTDLRNGIPLKPRFKGKDMEDEFFEVVDPVLTKGTLVDEMASLALKNGWKIDPDELLTLLKKV